MDMADSSLIVAADALGARRVFTIDCEDFETFHIRRLHRHHAVETVLLTDHSPRHVRSKFTGKA